VYGEKYKKTKTKEIKSFNLADLITVDKVPIIKEKNYREDLIIDTEIIDAELIEEANDIKTFMTIAKDMYKKYNISVDNDSIKDAVISHIIKSFSKTMYVSPEFNHICRDLNIDNNLVSTSQLPRTKLKNITFLAELLDMVIIESKYLTQKVIDSADYYSSIAINKFKKVDKILTEANSTKKVYALTPLSNLSLTEYINDKNSNIKYVPNSLKQAQITIDLQKPFLRTLMVRISNLESRVDLLEEEMEVIKTSMQEIASREIALEDPMLFITDDNFKEDNEVIIGPIWGEDMKIENVRKKLEIKRQTRNKLKKIIEIYGYYY